ncbi:MOSC domain-containing protein [Nocardioides nanhaiensis]|uniref:MOSC domain-containing protein n=1 Tax=Nocardioides nanhaiensis TaxID=1476871 RepID=A0ABP8WI50_9ACTN
MTTVAALHVAPGRRLPTRSVTEVEVEAAAGIVGDRYHGSRHRQVTVQSAQALAEAAELFGAPVPAGLTRRNVTVSDGVVPTAPGSLIRLGSQVVLEVVRVAAPCKLLDDTIGDGAQGVLRRGRGGAVCRVLAGGPVRLGDVVELGTDDVELAPLRGAIGVPAPARRRHLP